MLQFLTPLALLACPIGMGLMMFFMGRGAMGGRRKADEGTLAIDGQPAVTLVELNAEQARLSEQVDHDSTPPGSRASRSMTTAILIGAIIAGTAACPLLHWFGERRAAGIAAPRQRNRGNLRSGHPKRACRRAWTPSRNNASGQGTANGPWEARWR